jgi:serine/threonine-protein kinase
LHELSAVLSLSNPQPLVGTVLDGRFEILSTLGNGTMSVVVAARHLQLRQKVAIKMLRPEFATFPDVVTRFLREARAAACLRNEHVVSVTDVGMLPTAVPYLIMEYLEGTDLAAHLAAHGPLTVDLAVEYVFQVLEALAEAHRAGIVHRDIKPANLLLTHREDGSALVKVLDFGVSKFTGPEYTAHGLTMQAPLLGSPAYMSPEQIRDPSDVDARTDIWSVGVVLFELVTGQLPFAGRTAQDLVAAICSPNPTPISNLISRIPIELVGVIGRCVHKAREGRFPDVQELARALLPFVRTAASQVSVDRVLGIASAPRPVAADLEEQLSKAPFSGAPIQPERMTFGGPKPSRARTALMVAGALSACAAGWALAKAVRGGGEDSVASNPPPAAEAGVCTTPEATKNTCEPSSPGAPSPAVVGGAPAGAVAAPAVAGLTAPGPAPKRTGVRAIPRSEPVMPGAPLVTRPGEARDVAESFPRAVFTYPGARSLDADNPYAKIR